MLARALDETGPAGTTMARDPLVALLRVRRIALDEARRALAVCLAAEARAARSLTEAEAEIVGERATAASARR